jgi:hypothetical protein
MIAAGVNKAQIPRRSIATMEHLTGDARALIRRNRSRARGVGVEFSLKRMAALQSE